MQKGIPVKIVEVIQLNTISIMISHAQHECDFPFTLKSNNNSSYEY